VYTDKNAAQVEEYVSAVTAEAALYSGRPALSGRPVDFVYFGGGTPSFISTKHLRQLVEGLRERFDWGRLREFAFECEPGTLTQSKLETIRDLGVTRLSLGVEHFDDRILAENGRAHVSKEIYRVLPWIRELGFPQLNIDLIAGLVGESWETWKDAVERTLEIAPDSVTIYQLELPYNTVYSRAKLEGDGGPSVADWQTKREWHAYAIDRMTECGYEVSSAYTLVKKGSKDPFVYRDSLWEGADLLPLGVSSFGHLSGVHFQNLAAWTPYLDAVHAGRLPVFRAFATSADERLTRELILQLKRGYLSLGPLSEKFSVDVAERFGPVFEGLERDGWLRLDGQEVRLSRPGMLQVDRLLPAFYDPRYRGARYT
ncbi:MAG: coproporphyrinogen III oxidase family protein, partial [Acidobacteria bacterium]|nr:coproporphyrinogen III oxidase family protein [Acidobacteriota bacterium]